MPRIICPVCAANYTIAQENLGKIVLCQKCHKQFVATPSQNPTTVRKQASTDLSVEAAKQRAASPPSAPRPSFPAMPAVREPAARPSRRNSYALLAIASLFVTSVLGAGAALLFLPKAEEPPAALPTGDRFGGIEIHAQSVRAIVIEFTPDQEGGTDYNFVKKFNNSTVKPGQGLEHGKRFDPLVLQNTAAAVEHFYHQFRDSAGFSLPPERIVIMCNEGLFEPEKVKAPTANDQNPEELLAINQALLGDAVYEATGHPVEFVNRNAEVKLCIQSLVPAKRLDDTLYIKLTSKSFRGGALDSKSGRLTVIEGMGYKDFAAMMKKKSEDSSKLANSAVGGPLAKDLVKKQTLINRPRVQLGGAVAWVLATQLNPTECDEKHFPQAKLIPEEVRSFCEKLRADRAIPPFRPPESVEGDFKSQLLEDDDQQRHRVFAKVDRLIAGTYILDALGERLQFRRDIYVSNYDLYGELLGLMVKKRLEAPQEQERFLAAKRALDGRQQLVKSLNQVDELLKNKDAARARDSLAQAPKRYASDPGLSKRIRDLEENINAGELGQALEIAMQQGYAALENLDIPKAKIAFQRANERRPGDASVKEAQAAVDAWAGAEQHLERAKTLSAENQLESAFKEAVSAKTLTEPVLKALNYKLVDLAKKMHLKTSRVLLELAKQFEAGADAKKKASDAAAAKYDSGKAGDEIRDATDYLQRALELLEEIRAPLRQELAEAVNSSERSLAEKKGLFARARQRLAALDALAVAQEALLSGKRLFASAKGDGVKLLAAQARLQEAVSQLESVQRAFPEAASETARDWEDAKKHLDMILTKLCPIDLDFRKHEVPEDWDQGRNKWAKLTRAQRFWLQATDGGEATLTSPVREFPQHFELYIVIAVVSADGTIDNAFLAGKEGLVKIKLVSADKPAEPLVVVLGKDPKTRSADLPSILVGKNYHGISPKKELILVRISCAGGIAAVSVNGIGVGSAPAGGDFHQLVIAASNDVKGRGFAGIQSILLKDPVYKAAVVAIAPANQPVAGTPTDETRFVLYALENFLEDTWPNRNGLTNEGSVRSFIARRERVIHDLADRVKQASLGGKYSERLIEQLEVYMKVVRDLGEEHAAGLVRCREPLMERYVEIFGRANREAALRRFQTSARVANMAVDSLSRSDSNGLDGLFSTVIAGMIEGARTQAEINFIQNNASREWQAYLNGPDGQQAYQTRASELVMRFMPLLQTQLAARRKEAAALAEFGECQFMVAE